MNLRQTLTMPLRAPLLDRELLAGVDPRRDRLLEMRAQRVSSNRRRNRLAAALEQVLAEAGASMARSAKAPVARQDVLDARVLLLDLARRLRSDAPVDPQGVLLVRRLLSDPASPLATGSGEVSLNTALRHANAALDPRRSDHHPSRNGWWPMPGPGADDCA